jgi:hypothetical protein
MKHVLKSKRPDRGSKVEVVPNDADSMLLRRKLAAHSIGPMEELVSRAA